MYNYTEIDPINVIGKVECPIFFIHEEYDELIVWEDVQLLHHAPKNPSNLIWQIEGTAKSLSYSSQPVEYNEKVNNFLSQIAVATR